MVTLVNRAKMTTSTTGTGTITLGIAETGYQSFADAGVVDGDVVRYVIEDGDAWEIGIGTYTASGTTLSRTAAESSNADAALNLSGDAVVYVSATDADFREDAVGNVTGNATLDLSTGNVFSHTPTADTTFVFNNPPSSGTAYGFTLKITGDEVSVAYDLGTASYDSVSFSVAGQDTNPYSAAFKNDGTKMYMVGRDTDSVYQYSVSTAWDLSTASYDSVSFSVAGQVDVPVKILFASDGTRMFVPDRDTASVYQYSLSTAWDLSTASYDSVSFSVAGQDKDPSNTLLPSSPSSLVFKTDGTKMYMLGSTTDSVYQYSLSTAWDLSTASYDSVSFSVEGQDEIPVSIAFKNDGTKMYMMGTLTDSVYQYSLSTAWDLSTASYDSVSFSVEGQNEAPLDLVFKDDGTKMYMVGTDADSVYQYTTLSTPAAATFTYPASVDWPGGTAPDSPADGETDVLVFYTEDGGTTYYGFQAGDAMA